MKTTSMKIKIRLLTEFLGTVPKNPEIYKAYVESKKPADKDDEDESANVEEIEEKGWTGFHSDDQGLFIYEYMIKGFLKHAGNVLKAELGIKNLRSKLDDFVFISPRRIHLGRKEPDGTKEQKLRINNDLVYNTAEPPPSAADGVVERPLRGMTPKGPRVTLARSDYINIGTELEFEIRLLKHPEIKEKTILELLEYGELMGLGQFRNGGYGRFEVM